jgi:small multidrug resistance pump
MMNLEKYRYWFYAAAIYNFLWGTINVLFPDLFFNLINMPAPEIRPIWQVVGMFVLVYAPAYWWAGRYPAKHPHLILIGLLGKILGPVGFVFSVLTNQLPLAFGWTLLFNDFIWWIPFTLYLRDVTQAQGGFVRLLSGE